MQPCREILGNLPNMVLVIEGSVKGDLVAAYWVCGSLGLDTEALIVSRVM